MKNKSSIIEALALNTKNVIIFLYLTMFKGTIILSENHKYPIIDLSICKEPLPLEEIKKIISYVYDPKIRAWLGFIARCEGTYKIKNDTGEFDGIIPQSHQYLICFTNVVADSFDKHPNIVHEIVTSKGIKLRSSASGRYQFLTKTWNEILRLIDIKTFLITHKHTLSKIFKKHIVELYKNDTSNILQYKKYNDLVKYEFGPFMQDLAAIVLLYKANVIQDILKENFKTAIFKCAPIWASLPCSEQDKSYFSGQPAFTLKKALEICTEMKEASEKYFKNKNSNSKNKSKKNNKNGKNI